MKARAIATLALGACVLAAAGALADTLRPGDRLAGETKPSAAVAFTTALPGPAGGLAVHADGRVAVLARQELVLLDAHGGTQVRRGLPGPARFVTFGAGESVVSELAGGSAVLRYRDLFARAWDLGLRTASSALVEPAALPFGGFVLARGTEIVFTDGEAHEQRRLHLPSDYEAQKVQVLDSADAPRGVYVQAAHGNDTALVYCAWGERALVRAVVHGKASDTHFTSAGLELALDDGSLAHVDPSSGAIHRLQLPDDAYAVTALRYGRSVAILRGQLVVFRRDAGRLRSGGAFGAPVNRTDAGMVVPRVIVAAANEREPLWILTNDGSLSRADDVEARTVYGARCGATPAEGSSTPAFLAATTGRVVIACQNRVVAILSQERPTAPASGGPADAGFRW